MKELPAGFGGDELVAKAGRGFARGLVVALPLSLIAWLVIIWMV